MSPGAGRGILWLCTALLGIALSAPGQRGRKTTLLNRRWHKKKVHSPAAFGLRVLGCPLGNNITKTTANYPFPGVIGRSGRPFGCGMPRVAVLVARCWGLRLHGSILLQGLAHPRCQKCMFSAFSPWAACGRAILPLTGASWDWWRLGHRAE